MSGHQDAALGKPSHPIYIDCDTGIDDAVAIAYLLAGSSGDVAGIGTVFGNTSASRAASNTLALLELAGGHDIPVAIGSAHPLTGPFPGGAPAIHGADGVGGVGLETHGSTVADTDAVALLAGLVEARYGHLRVLALGPLTNLAHFVRGRPDLLPGVAEVVVMGGAFDVRGNVSAFAEANIWHDPEAAELVFSANWPVTVLPLDITMRHLLRADQVEHIRGMKGNMPPTLAAMLDTYLDAYCSILGVRECALHDPLAAMVADRGVRVAAAQETGINVVLEGPERGRTVAVVPRSAAARQRIVKHVDASAADVLVARLEGHVWP